MNPHRGRSKILETSVNGMSPQQATHTNVNETVRCQWLRDGADFIKKNFGAGPALILGAGLNGSGE